MSVDNFVERMLNETAESGKHVFLTGESADDIVETYEDDLEELGVKVKGDRLVYKGKKSAKIDFEDDYVSVLENIILAIEEIGLSVVLVDAPYYYLVSDHQISDSEAKKLFDKEFSGEEDEDEI